MILQPILFPKEDICKETELYYRGSSIQFGSQHHLELNQHISFDTYFNIFSMSKWKEFTFVENVSLNLNIRGACQIDLFESSIVNDKISRIKLATIEKDASRDSITIDFPDIINIREVCYFVITASKTPCTIINGYYSTKIDTDRLNRVKLGIGICTYKREQFILKNLNAIRAEHLDNKESPLYDNLEIFVSDNGQTLDQYNFSHPKIRIYPNINAGGTGGFSRCMIEAIKENHQLQLTHFILMDDDIVLDSAILQRTYYFLAIVKKEYQGNMVGGVMLRLEKPWEQHANGETWTFNLSNPFCSLGKNVDLRDFKNTLCNIKSTANNYNGWWYCCIPITTISENNLPLPLFIHRDDIEYGVRNGKETILIEGIAIWHSFENKESPALVYYDNRNDLIVSLLRAPHKSNLRMQFIIRILSNFVQSIATSKYNEWYAQKKAFEDVFTGANHFMNLECEATHKSLKNYCATEISVEHKIIKKTSNRRTFFFKHPSQTIRKIIVIISFISHFLPCFIRKRTASPPTPQDFIFCSEMHYMIGNKCIIYKNNFKTNLEITSEAISLCYSVFKNFSKIRADYKANESMLTNIEFWKKYLKLT